ncbi:HlyD family efflux transporter periplasmic adaptor subunit [Rhodocista pekingensis]|uniref:HlyD family efflux transporter periplasmic adaptor subunit n=1 Tax=Rhodocista pekingensis TaxID=201185 RepID=A0ABW2L1E9_9PROT
MTNAQPLRPVPVEPPRPAPDRHLLRKRLLAGIAAIVLAAAAGYGGWYMLVGATHVGTDNAYVGADSAQITPLISAPVKAVPVSDTQRVARGDVLVELDDADTRIALARAEAELQQARRQFERTVATSAALAGQVAAREAEIDRARAQLVVAQANFDKAKIDLERRRNLAKGGAVSAEELTTATNAFTAAQANLTLARAGVTQAEAALAAAKGDLSANEALVAGSTVDTDPAVVAARARLDQARLDQERTVIRAPVDGIVTRRQVQVGQRVAAGAPVMTIVPVDQLYVDANFKEGQLTRVRVGQKVTLVSDLYGPDVVYHGRVAGLAGGTGAAFALIPAQNATGNWIKVVQRLPVRVTLDPDELKAHPLRVGLSMDAEIDLSDAD